MGVNVCNHLRIGNTMYNFVCWHRVLWQSNIGIVPFDSLMVLLVSCILDHYQTPGSLHRSFHLLSWCLMVFKVVYTDARSNPHRVRSNRCWGLSTSYLGKGGVRWCLTLVLFKMWMQPPHLSLYYRFDWMPLPAIVCILVLWLDDPPLLYLY